VCQSYSPPKQDKAKANAWIEGTYTLPKINIVYKTMGNASKKLASRKKKKRKSTLKQVATTRGISENCFNFSFKNSLPIDYPAVQGSNWKLKKKEIECNPTQTSEIGVDSVCDVKEPSK
jgi:hypothetical protein